MSEAHSSAVKSFESNHLLYDQFRPSFSPKIVNQFLINLGLGIEQDESPKYYTNKIILELAAGTGKFTKNLVSNGWSENLIVVEPSIGMLESFQLNFPKVRAIRGSSYNIPLPDSSVDSVIIAQGFHWFSDIESLKEMNRVLKPNGTFGCIWNFDCPSISQKLQEPIPEVEFLYENVPGEAISMHDSVVVSNPTDTSNIIEEFFKLHAWSMAVSKYVYSFDIDVPKYRHGKWREVLGKGNPYFNPISKENVLLYVSQIKPDDVFKYWETRSFITALKDNEKLLLKQSIEELLVKYVTDNDKVIIGNELYLDRSMCTHSIASRVNK